MKRIVIDVIEKEHTLIKQLAAQEGLSMRRWILLAIALKIRMDNTVKKK